MDLLWSCGFFSLALRTASGRRERLRYRTSSSLKCLPLVRRSILTPNSRWAKRTRGSLLCRSRCFTTMSLLVSLALARSPAALSWILLARSKPASHQHRAEMSSNLLVLALVYLALPTGLIDRISTSLLPPYTAAVADPLYSRMVPIFGFANYATASSRPYRLAQMASDVGHRLWSCLVAQTWFGR